MSTRLQLFIADAFTKNAFSGNSAAVCLVPNNVIVPKAVRQKIAAEMNSPETAFVEIFKDGDTFQTGNIFGLSWFTPKCEVPLCGHATLASTSVLFNAFGNQNEILEFNTVSGILKAKKCEKNQIEIDLPAYESVSVLGKYDEVVKVAVADLTVQDVSLSESRKLIVRLDDKVSRTQLEALRPNTEVLASTTGAIKGLIVTVSGQGKLDCVDADGQKYDFVSRYFAPWVGVPEDPVTGSAHSILAPYWSKILGKKKFYARQCSKRGGDLDVELSGSRVFIKGHSVIVVKGEISF